MYSEHIEYSEKYLKSLMRSVFPYRLAAQKNVPGALHESTCPNSGHARYRNVNYATFQQTINRLVLNDIRTSKGVTRLYNQRRQLVAFIALPSLDNVGHGNNAPRYYLCNNPRQRFAAINPLPLLALFAQQLGRGLRKLHNNLLASFERRLGNDTHQPAARPAVQLTVDRVRHKCARGDVATRSQPVWNTLRLTA